MADLLTILANSSTSLAAHRTSAATASHNLANVNTPGYSRQTATLEALTPAEIITGAFVGRGTTLQGITQARDLFLERQMPSALGARGWSTAEFESLGAVSALDPEATGGLSNALSAFYSSLRAVSQNPGDRSLRQAAVSSAQALTRSFNRTAEAIADARNGLDQKISGSLQEINNAAAAVANLNRQIRMARANGGEPNDLIDQRRQLVDRLAEMTGASTVTNNRGDVSLALRGGMALVNEDNAAELSTTPDPANGGHVSLLIKKTDGSGPFALGASVVGGQIGGLLSARDGAIATAERSLDQLAFDLGTAVNGVHRAGYGLNGATGNDLFDVGATSSGAAARIDVTAALLGDASLLAAASDPAAVPGDNRNMLALIATERQALSGGADAASALQSIVTGFGAATRRAEAMRDQDDGILQHLSDLRESVSGVSIDEEMINMSRAQRAFEAVSKVITATDAMLDTLMRLK